MRRFTLPGVGLLLAGAAVVSLSSGAVLAAPAAPPQSTVNKLNAVVNNLDSLHARLSDVLAHPPEPGKSGINGTVGRLDAMAGKLGVLFDRVAAAGPPPDDQIPPPDDGNPPPDDGNPPPDDTRPALLRVRDGALAIVTAAQPPPDDGVPPPDDGNPPPDDQIRFREALDGVAGAAQALADLASDLLRGGLIGGG